MKHFIYSLSFLCINVLGFSQSEQNDPYLDVQDTINIDSIDYEAYTKKTNSFKVIFSGEPGRAALYSLVIPGGGQFYNRKYWKVPIIWAADGIAFYNAYFNYTEYLAFKNGYIDLFNGDVINVRGFTSISTVRRYRDLFRKNYETAAIIGAGVHLLTVIEAYVDRHLMDFDISEDLSFFVTPAHALEPYLAVGIQISLH